MPPLFYCMLQIMLEGLLFFYITSFHYATLKAASPDHVGVTSCRFTTVWINNARTVLVGIFFLLCLHRSICCERKKITIRRHKKYTKVEHSVVDSKASSRLQSPFVIQASFLLCYKASKRKYRMTT
jgi:hypothetical protein